MFEAGDSDPRGLGLSPFAYNFIGGLIEHATSFAAVTCPTVNSYKRIGVAPPNSGATWAPAYVAYGGNNRSQMFRVPEGNRTECRVVDGSANPYLAFTVLAAAGMDGVARKLDPGEPNTQNLFSLDPAEVAKLGIKAMPSTLPRGRRQPARRRRAARRARHRPERRLRRLLLPTPRPRSSGPGTRSCRTGRSSGTSR